MKKTSYRYPSLSHRLDGIATWFLKHTELWRGKEIIHNSDAHRLIVRALKTDGIYSQKTSVVDIPVNAHIQRAERKAAGK